MEAFKDHGKINKQHKGTVPPRQKKNEKESKGSVNQYFPQAQVQMEGSTQVDPSSSRGKSPPDPVKLQTASPEGDESAASPGLPSYRHLSTVAPVPFLNHFS